MQLPIHERYFGKVLHADAAVPSESTPRGGSVGHGIVSKTRMSEQTYCTYLQQPACNMAVNVACNKQ